MFKPSKKLTIGYFKTLPTACEAVPAMKRGVEMAKKALEKKGHKLVPFEVPSPETPYLLMCEAFVADGGLDTGELLAADVEISYPNQHLEAATWPNWYRNLIAWSSRSAAGDLPIDALLAMVPHDHPHGLNIILRKIKEYRKIMLDAMADMGIDALLGPAFACPAVHLDTPRDIFSAATYTGMYNCLNWPAGIVPVTKVNENDEVCLCWSLFIEIQNLFVFFLCFQKAMSGYPEVDVHHKAIKASLTSGSVGLPVAIQIASKPYCEEIVLRLMHDVESNI